MLIVDLHIHNEEEDYHEFLILNETHYIEPEIYNILSRIKTRDNRFQGPEFYLKHLKELGYSVEILEPDIKI